MNLNITDRQFYVMVTISIICMASGGKIFGEYFNMILGMIMMILVILFLIWNAQSS